MNKTARIFLTLILVIFVLSGCTSKQAPSQYSDEGGSLGDMDFIPDGDPFDASLDSAGLEARDEGDGIGNDKYGDFTMVEGLLPSIYFDFDSFSVGASERSKLQQAAEYLEQNSEHLLLVEGHCDWYGTSDYNLALGDLRANSISDYLGTLGISPLRIEKLSKGSLEATSGLSKLLSSKNRRADLIVLKK
jgi:peptidoglycan-associated lipoprotein|tara:strand:- start:35 stop:604 length:570 start_codon:yes stop_codon:yes gene_type:complete